MRLRISLQQRRRKMAKRKFKTKEKLSGTKTEYRAWDSWTEEDEVIGTLIGSTKNRNNPTKKDWLMKVEEANFANAKEAKALVGKTLTLNSAGMLDKGMELLEKGELFKVTYNGKGKMEGGKFKGKSAHKMEVESIEEDDGSDFDDVDDSDDSDDDSEDTDDSDDNDDGDDL